MPAPQSETSVVEREVRIEAEPEVVFPFFTEPEKMVRWMGIGATLDPRPGGVFSVNMVAQHVNIGEYLAIEPHTRIVFTWRSPTAGEGSRVTLRFADAPGGQTQLILEHEGLPDAEVRSDHHSGWSHILMELSALD